jgi:hypothetical protein
MENRVRIMMFNGTFNNISVISATCKDYEVDNFYKIFVIIVSLNGLITR